MDVNKDLVAASATPLVLAILAEGDSYGYAIIKRVAEVSGGHLKWTDGMLYPVLHRLERQGYVAAKWSAAVAMCSSTTRVASATSPRSIASMIGACRSRDIMVGAR